MFISYYDMLGWGWFAWSPLSVPRGGGPPPVTFFCLNVFCYLVVNVLSLGYVVISCSV